MNDLALAKAVQDAARPKFRGRKTLNSKVVPHYPANLEREYTRMVNAYMAMVGEAAKKLIAVVKRQEASNLRQDAMDEDTRKAYRKILAELKQKQGSFNLYGKLEKLAKSAVKLSAKAWARTIRQTLGINIYEDYYLGEFFRQQVKQWAASNAALISTVPGQSMDKLQNLMEQGFDNARPAASIAKDIAEQYGVDKRRAQFWARDQMAKLNSQITRAQQEDAGCTEYTWSTSHDERVRDRHRELDGKKFSWADPPVMDDGTQKNPGEDYNCRCVARAVLDIDGLTLPAPYTDEDVRKNKELWQAAMTAPGYPSRPAGYWRGGQYFSE
jgi:SPP1 gp7 family putative phage head morphogenesis protein